MHHEVVTRQNTFILAVTGSAIAFALHQTSDRTWSNSLIPVGLALLVWASGFVAGIVNGHAKQTAIKANLIINQAEKANDAERHKIGDDMWKGANRKAQNTYKVQLWALLIGALFYVAGHAMHIWERTPASKPQVVALPTKIEVEKKAVKALPSNEVVPANHQ